MYYVTFHIFWASACGGSVFVNAFHCLWTLIVRILVRAVVCSLTLELNRKQPRVSCHIYFREWDTVSSRDTSSTFENFMSSSAVGSFPFSHIPLFPLASTLAALPFSGFLSFLLFFFVNFSFTSCECFGV